MSNDFYLEYEKAGTIAGIPYNICVAGAFLFGIMIDKIGRRP